MSNNILVIIGTRPEAIKLSPLVLELNKRAKNTKLKSIICLTGQHAELAMNVLKLFALTPDYNLETLSPNQSLNQLSSKLILGLEKVITKEQPKLVVVQGDTTSAMIGALAAFYNKIPVLHVEAGLRSEDKMSPYPEEVNRRIISQIASIHAAPTQLAAENLAILGITENVIITGNSGIDALRMVSENISNSGSTTPINSTIANIDDTKFNIILTLHRRENIGQATVDICQAINKLSSIHTSLKFIVILHPNPNISEVLREGLKNNNSVEMIEPLKYEEMVSTLNKVSLIMTDSGGLQEEATFLGLPTLVLRENTERQEAIEMGISQLVGSNVEKIIQSIDDLISNKVAYQKMAQKSNVFGDGHASLLIVDKIISYLT